MSIVQHSCVCNGCGSQKAVAISRPDSVRIDCPVCGHTEFIWDDDEYEENDDLGPHCSVDGWGEENMP
jgi:hypothetical protein